MINFWLQSALSSAGMTQTELAKRLTEALGRSVDRAAVNKMAAGERRVLAEEMLETARICNFPLPQVGKKTLSEYERALSAIQVAIAKSEFPPKTRPLFDDDTLHITVSSLKKRLYDHLVSMNFGEKNADHTVDEFIAALRNSASGAQIFLVS